MSLVLTTRHAISAISLRAQSTTVRVALTPAEQLREARALARRFVLAFSAATVLVYAIAASGLTF